MALTITPVRIVISSTISYWLCVYGVCLLPRTTGFSNLRVLGQHYMVCICCTYLEINIGTNQKSWQTLAHILTHWWVSMSFKDKTSFPLLNPQATLMLQ